MSDGIKYELLIASLNSTYIKLAADNYSLPHFWSPEIKQKKFKPMTKFLSTGDWPWKNMRPIT
jgi:hypothetical protein